MRISLAWLSDWVDAGHYRETKRDTDGRRRVFITAAADGTSRPIGDPDNAYFGPGAAFRIATRNHDLVRIDADGTERVLTATSLAEVFADRRRVVLERGLGHDHHALLAQVGGVGELRQLAPHRPDDGQGEQYDGYGGVKRRHAATVMPPGAEENRQVCGSRSRAARR